jgi:hypothetical protein
VDKKIRDNLILPMKNLMTTLFLIYIAFSASCQAPSKELFPESFSIDLRNPLPVSRKNALVVLSSEKIKAKAPKFNSAAFIVLIGNVELPSQYNARDIHHPGVSFVLPELKGNEKLRVTIRYATKGAIARDYKKKTQAEISRKEGGKWVNREYIGGKFKNVQALRVPPEHKDHSWFIRYEGPGWESDMVGYRFYLDQRNATDVFGKKVTDPVLQNVGQEGFDSYHELQPWGMDVMKVGKSLGIGSIGYLKDHHAVRVEKTDSVSCAILENGPIYSSLVTHYYGWNTGDQKCSLESSISIHSGTRVTEQKIKVTGNIKQLATGIVKDTLAALITSKGDGQSLGYVATYGKQSLNNDNLGLVVFFRPSDLVSMTEDDQSHIIVLHVNDQQVNYYFAAAWDKEPGGITTVEEFKKYLGVVASELANPVEVTF